MNLVKENILVTRNARDKVQVAKFYLYQNGNSYIIKRFTGQYNGKITEQPDKVIDKGKAKRSVQIQAELEYNSLMNKSLNKGYKNLASLTKTHFDDIEDTVIDKLVPTLKTDAAGNIKPQLAKSSNDCTINIWDKEMFCSRKIDGVRCLMKWDEKKEEVVTISRGGKDYNPSTVHLRENDLIKDFLKNNKELILDGELYVHGWSLQKISGTCRLKTWDPNRCPNIEYWVYDIVDMNRDFNKRLDTLIDLSILFEEESHVKVLEHILTKSWYQAKKLHDQFVTEGFEGLVARKPFRNYAAGKRNSDWVKLKDYQEDEFEIVGISEKAREEDFTFTLITKEGKEFDAKPIGTREERFELLDNWESLVGKMGTVKFFNWTDDNVPSQPSFRCVRDYE